MYRIRNKIHSTMKLHALIIGLGLMLISMADAEAQDIKTYDSFDSYKQLLEKDNDTTYIINYWATWCRPCVKELPEFKKVYNEMKDEKVRFILTSMDFGNNIETRVKTFLKKHEIPSGMKVVILDDADSNSWIEKVNPEWSGSIPATLIYRNNEKDFYEQEFQYEELKRAVQTKIQ